VSDVDRSAQWYQALLGTAQVIHREGPGWVRIRMQWPNGLVIGVTEHEATTGSPFDESRIGLDHIGLGCKDESEVRAWHDVLDRLGFEHGPVEDVPYGWAVTARDPDGIPVEFFCSRA
jgi:glyoxylase I family protein